MENYKIRLAKIELNNFKNVEHGGINLKNEEFKPAIVGLYGQNGSGKTAVVEAFNLFNKIVMGLAVPSYYKDLIMLGKDKASFVFGFELTNEKKNIYLEYEFSIGINIQENKIFRALPNESKVMVFGEKLSYSVDEDGKKRRFQRYIDTNSNEAFEPVSKLEAITNNDLSLKMNLKFVRDTIHRNGKSFIFEEDLIRILLKNKDNQELVDILVALHNYDIANVYVITNEFLKEINTQVFLLTCLAKSHDIKYIENVRVPMLGTFTINKAVFKLIEDSFKAINLVLNSIVPGTQIKLKKIGNALTKDGENGYMAEVVSVKGDKELPVLYESEGIKKIISILCVLIAMYNNESSLVVVDELDSGVFEYLLGELMQVIKDGGLGQLIFTSHNLRPLEVLDYKDIYFTTTNAKERYVQLKNIKTNNNLRSTYYREIVLGSDDTDLYNETKKYKIANAFMNAGDIYEK